MIARYCEFADYNSSNSRILQLEFLNLLFKLYLLYTYFSIPDSDTCFAGIAKKSNMASLRQYRFYEPADHQSSTINHCDVSVSRHHRE